MNSERRKGYYSAGEDIAIATEQTQLPFLLVGSRSQPIQNFEISALFGEENLLPE